MSARETCASKLNTTKAANAATGWNRDFMEGSPYFVRGGPICQNSRHHARARFPCSPQTTRPASGPHYGLGRVLEPATSSFRCSMVSAVGKPPLRGAAVSQPLLPLSDEAAPVVQHQVFFFVEPQTLEPGGDFRGRQFSHFMQRAQRRVCLCVRTIPRKFRQLIIQPLNSIWGAGNSSRGLFHCATLTRTSHLQQTKAPSAANLVARRPQTGTVFPAEEKLPDRA